MCGGFGVVNVLGAGTCGLADPDCHARELEQNAAPVALQPLGSNGSRAAGAALRRRLPFPWAQTRCTGQETSGSEALPPGAGSGAAARLRLWDPPIPAGTAPGARRVSRRDGGRGRRVERGGEAMTGARPCATEQREIRGAAAEEPAGQARPPEAAGVAMSGARGAGWALGSLLLLAASVLSAALLAPGGSPGRGECVSPPPPRRARLAGTGRAAVPRTREGREKKKLPERCRRSGTAGLGPASAVGSALFAAFRGHGLVRPLVAFPRNSEVP